MFQPIFNTKHQRGAVLIVGLIMLLLLTMIGLTSIRGSDLQERMAGNMRDRNLAFQAAEGALRLAEDTLSTATSLSKFDGKTIGYWPDLNTSTNYNSDFVGSWPYLTGGSGPLRLSPAVWLESQWNSNSLQVAARTIPGVSQQPRYTIEQIVVNATAANKGGGIDIESLEKMAEAEYYRLTARGLGGTADAEAVIQTTFIR